MPTRLSHSCDNVVATWHVKSSTIIHVCTSPLLARVSSRPATAAVDWGEMSSGLDVKASS